MTDAGEARDRAWADDWNPDREAEKIAAAKTVTEKLKLDTVGLEVTSARWIGDGREASVDIVLSDGSTLYFRQAKDLMTSRPLMETVAATTGALPELKDKDAREIAALTRKIGEITEVESDDGRATGYGREYLAQVEYLDVDMSDQGQRWAAFSHLKALHPFDRSRADGIPLARANVVLRNHDDLLYVRSGWFTSYVRGEDSTLSPPRVVTMMVRVGWQRPGKDGRIKATRPEVAGSEVMRFFIVPAGWDEMDPVNAGERSTESPGERVNAGERLDHAHARTGELHTPAFTRPPDLREAA